MTAAGGHRRCPDCLYSSQQAATAAALHRCAAWAGRDLAAIDACCWQPQVSPRCLLLFCSIYVPRPISAGDRTRNNSSSRRAALDICPAAVQRLADKVMTLEEQHYRTSLDGCTGDGITRLEIEQLYSDLQLLHRGRYVPEAAVWLVVYQQVCRMCIESVWSRPVCDVATGTHATCLRGALWAVFASGLA